MHCPVDFLPPAQVLAELEMLQVDDEYGQDHEEVVPLCGVDVHPAPGGCCMMRSNANCHPLLVVPVIPIVCIISVASPMPQQH